MRTLMIVMFALAAVVGLSACQGEQASAPTEPSNPRLEVSLSSASVAVDQEVRILVHGGNGDYRVSLVAYNYGGYPELDMSTCLGYLSQSYNGATFLFHPQETCSSRPGSVQVYVRDTDGDTNAATTLVLKY